MPEEQHENQTIASAANICLLSFQKCMRHSTAFGARERALIQNQLGRFSLWSDNIGVYAPARASIDYRLREVDDIRRVVRGILNALQSSLDECTSAIEICNAATLTSDDFENENINLKDAKSIFERANETLAEDITLLYQLSNTIQRAGRESQNSKAATNFEIKDGDGNRIEDALISAFKQNLSDQFPNAEEHLIGRLASTMVVRRKQILYRRSRRPKRQKHLPVDNPEPTFSTEPQDPVVVSLIPTELPERTQERSERETVPKPSGSKPVVAQSRAKTTTTLDLAKLRHPSTQSVVSGTKTISLMLDDHLVFPPSPRASIRERFKQLKSHRKVDREYELSQIPNYTQFILNKEIPASVAQEIKEQITKINKNFAAAVEADRQECNSIETEVVCPYCLDALSSSKMRNIGNWREHLKADLNPYVCLFRDCRDSETLFAHSEQWLAHMKQHALRWKCRAKSHEPKKFSEKAEYEDHMKIYHKGTFSDGQLSVLSERNARTFGPLFSSCPLCGIEEDDENLLDSLEAHIVGHLRFLALKSLPLIDEEIEDSDSSRSAASNDSAKPCDRSTLRDLLGHEFELTYDISESSIEVNSSSMSLWEPGNSNGFTPWGGLQDYVQRFYEHSVDGALPTTIGGHWGVSFRHPYAHWDDDTIRDILENAPYKSAEVETVPVLWKERLNQVIEERIDSFGSTGCPECGWIVAQQVVNLESWDPYAITRHILLHGDPEWFADTHGWSSNDSAAYIREIQWGQVLEASTQVSNPEEDPILQGILRQAKSPRSHPGEKRNEKVDGLRDFARAFLEDGVSKSGGGSSHNALVSALKSGILDCADSHMVFVPYDFLKSNLGASMIEDALKVAGTDPAQVSELRRFVERGSYRNFATLVEIDELRSLKKFLQTKVVSDDRQWTTSDIQASYRLRSIFGDASTSQFLSITWKYRAPVFSDKKFEYEVDEHCPLAFVKWDDRPSRGASSKVFQAELHPAHMVVRPRLLCGDPCKVVVKILDPAASEHDFLAENDVLWAMRKAEHRHLIKPIAAYMRGPTRAFILPRAKGTLEDLWLLQDAEARDSPMWIQWFLKQMRNIADAISLLHEGSSSQGHRGLKPKNIIWFDADETSPSPDDTFGILVVGDSGKGHGSRTSYFRTEASRQRYMSHEARVTDNFVRTIGSMESPIRENVKLTDSWSLGCICLEFILWILCGYSQLMEFRSETPDGFCGTDHTGQQRNELHSAVVNKVNDLKRHPLCTKAHPIRALLELVQNRLLIPQNHYTDYNDEDITGRATTRKLWEWLALACMVTGSQDPYAPGTHPDFEICMRREALAVLESTGKMLFYSDLHGGTMPAQGPPRV